ncbi:MULTISPECIES: DUF2066 domain-containing protein [Thalassospira]|uniref:DUF2066 domain-containing protein n=1 Tax=Thalassospira tepidiphila TaxID=393657 RepID=A0ABX0WZP8_9PROT|nr:MULTISPECIES: DUF2066 domain-containing protein [Thalassospira]NJB74745.1 hypothetical protein [Thalassospira tepidiphila]
MLTSLKNIKMWAGAATVAAIMAFPAAAQDIFTVSGVHVDERAETAAAARERALEIGQRKAFEEVVARLTLPEDRAGLATPETSVITNMVRDFGVSDEKTSSVRYIADMTVRFKDDELRRFLRFRDISFAELQSKPVMIVPVYRTNNFVNLWDDPNPWRDVWARNIATSGLVPIKAPIGDLTDISTVSAEQAESGSMERLSQLAKRYGADVAVVASAEVSGPEGGETVDVSVTRYEPNGAPQIFGVQEKTQAGETLNETLVRAAKSVQEQLADGWKRANLINYSTGGNLMVFIPITGLADWAGIENKLIGLPVVRNSRVIAMSKREVQVSIEYVGSANQLQTALNQQNLSLSRMGELWFIQPSGADRLQGLSLGG